jgi:hypothetical protein
MEFRVHYTCRIASAAWLSLHAGGSRACHALHSSDAHMHGVQGFCACNEPLHMKSQHGLQARATATLHSEGSHSTNNAPSLLHGHCLACCMPQHTALHCQHPAMHTQPMLHKSCSRINAGCSTAHSGHENKPYAWLPANAQLCRSKQLRSSSARPPPCSRNMQILCGDASNWCVSP